MFSLICFYAVLFAFWLSFLEIDCLTCSIDFILLFCLIKFVECACLGGA